MEVVQLNVLKYHLNPSTWNVAVRWYVYSRECDVTDKKVQLKNKTKRYIEQ